MQDLLPAMMRALMNCLNSSQEASAQEALRSASRRDRPRSHCRRPHTGRSSRAPPSRSSHLPTAHADASCSSGESFPLRPRFPVSASPLRQHPRHLYRSTDCSVLLAVRFRRRRQTGRRGQFMCT
ncbi:hypothetical protein VPH35_020782 [Triticum aestivum]